MKNLADWLLLTLILMMIGVCLLLSEGQKDIVEFEESVMYMYHIEEGGLQFDIDGSLKKIFISIVAEHHLAPRTERHVRKATLQVDWLDANNKILQSASLELDMSCRRPSPHQRLAPSFSLPNQPTRLLCEPRSLFLARPELKGVRSIRLRSLSQMHKYAWLDAMWVKAFGLERKTSDTNLSRASLLQYVNRKMHWPYYFDKHVQDIVPEQLFNMLNATWRSIEPSKISEAKPPVLFNRLRPLTSTPISERAYQQVTQERGVIWNLKGGGQAMIESEEQFMRVSVSIYNTENMIEHRENVPLPETIDLPDSAVSIHAILHDSSGRQSARIRLKSMPYDVLGLQNTTMLYDNKTEMSYGMTVHRIFDTYPLRPENKMFKAQMVLDEQEERDWSFSFFRERLASDQSYIEGTELRHVAREPHVPYPDTYCQIRFSQGVVNKGVSKPVSDKCGRTFRKKIMWREEPQRFFDDAAFVDERTGLQSSRSWRVRPPEGCRVVSLSCNQPLDIRAVERRPQLEKFLQTDERERINTYYGGLDSIVYALPFDRYFDVDARHLPSRQVRTVPSFRLKETPEPYYGRYKMVSPYDGQVELVYIEALPEGPQKMAWCEVPKSSHLGVTLPVDNQAASSGLLIANGWGDDSALGEDVTFVWNGQMMKSIELNELEHTLRMRALTPRTGELRFKGAPASTWWVRAEQAQRHSNCRRGFSVRKLLPGQKMRMPVPVTGPNGLALNVVAFAEQDFSMAEDQGPSIVTTVSGGREQSGIFDGQTMPQKLHNLKTLEQKKFYLSEHARPIQAYKSRSVHKIWPDAAGHRVFEVKNTASFPMWIYVIHRGGGPQAHVVQSRYERASTL